MKELHPLTKKALDILFDIQNKKPYHAPDVKALFEKACDTLPRDLLRMEFMPVMNQIWKEV